MSAFDFRNRDTDNNIAPLLSCHFWHCVKILYVIKTVIFDKSLPDVTYISQADGRVREYGSQSSKVKAYFDLNCGWMPCIAQQFEPGVDIYTKRFWMGREIIHYTQLKRIVLMHELEIDLDVWHFLFWVLSQKSV